MSILQEGSEEIETYSQLVGYFEDACKPRDAWRIGVEHEKFGYRCSDFAPLPYDDGSECSIVWILRALHERFGWHELREDGRLIGLIKDGAFVTLEPGGQVELSGATQRTVHQAAEESERHLAEIKMVAEEIGAGFFGMGTAPIWREKDMPMMPKGRYKIMYDAVARYGKYGHHIMFRTCAIQVSLDFKSEQDMVRKLRLALALQPIVTALFANSPFFDGKPTGMQSARRYYWSDLDRNRAGLADFVFEDGFGFERWTDFALDLPMYFYHHDGHYMDARGYTFRQLFEGKVPMAKGAVPLMSDWANHLTTVFTEARVKKFIEMRGADAGPLSMINALPALWVGIIYDSEAVDAAWDIVRRWRTDERNQLLADVAEQALNAQIAGRNVRDIARELLAVSRKGLTNRARLEGLERDECDYLDVLDKIVDSNRTLAQEDLRLYSGNWQKDLCNIYRQRSY